MKVVILLILILHSTDKTGIYKTATKFLKTDCKFLLSIGELDILRYHTYYSCFNNVYKHCVPISLLQPY